jgi:starch-binding outer membrane protein, SusD/RagB family
MNCMKTNIFKMQRGLLALIFVAIFSVSCGNDFLNVSPSTNAGDENLIQSASDLAIATEGAYETLSSASYYQGYYTYIPDLMGDLMMEPAWGSQHLKFYYAYGFSKVKAETSIFRSIYLGLHNINIILNKASKLTASAAIKANIAELRIIRAMMHFDLIRMYGPAYCNLGKGAIKADALGIRIAKEPIKDMRMAFYRDKVKDVYEFIKSEVEVSLPDMPKAKRNGFLNYWGAEAFLARVYQYMDLNDKAFTAAKDVIDNSGCKLYTIADYVSSWGMEYGSESLFEIATSLTDNAGYYSLGWICSEGGYKTVVPTSDFLELMKGNPSDVRFKLLQYSSKDKCYYISGKYPGREGNIKINNPKVIRLSEMYLIAAESALKLGNTAVAGKYLSDLREHRTTVAPRKYEASITIDDILYESALELYGEGHRAWDLWRNGKSVVRYTSPAEKDAKGHTDYLTDGTVAFDYYQAIYPIAESELLLLPEADRQSQQNPGY